MISTGLATLINNFFGGIPLNLAAITAALNANEHAHKNPARRWLASVWGGYVYFVIAALAGAAAVFVIQAPRDLILAAAGIALIGTIVSSLSSAMEDTTLRIPAMITFLVGASGVSVFDIGSAFWALIAGLLVWAWLNLKHA
jgi:benzoate membrane transport protein